MARLNYSRFLISPPGACPHCGREFREFTSTRRKAAPRSGFVLCPDCLHVLTLEPGIRTHLATPEEIAAAWPVEREGIFEAAARLEKARASKVRS